MKKSTTMKKIIDATQAPLFTRKHAHAVRAARFGSLLAGVLVAAAIQAEESGLPVLSVSPVDTNGVELLSGFPSFASPSVSVGPAERPLTHTVRNNGVGYMYRVIGGPYDGRIEYGPSTGTYADHVGFVKNGFNIAVGFGDDFRGVDGTSPSNGFSEPNPDGTRNYYCRPNNPVGDATDCDSWGFRLAGRSFSFKSMDRVGTFTDVTKSGNTVVKSGSRWIFTTNDGTTYTTIDTNLDDLSNFQFPNGPLESIKYPNGLQITIHYRNGRINIVSRNDGFALKYFYESVLGRTGVPENYVRPNRIVAYNGAVDFCDPAAEACTFTRTWPQATFSWTQQGAWNSKYTTTFNVSDAGGAVTRYTLDKYGRVIAVKTGAATEDVVIYEYCQNFDEFVFPAGHPERVRNCTQGQTDVVGSQPKDMDTVLHLTRGTGNGVNYTYTRASDYVSDASFAWSVAAGNGTDAAGNAVATGSVYQEGAHPSTLRMKNASSPSGLSAVFDQTEASRLVSATQEDGGTSTYGYDARGNVSLLTSTGTGMTARERGANFPASCANPVTCNKPTWISDYNGSRSDFTYDPVHGGALTVTAPAPAAGGTVRPQTRYTYTQRFAWIKNSTGAYVQAPTAIWLLNTESVCRNGGPAPSGTGCATATDEVLTTYDYGANSGPNNLLLRGKVVSGGGVTLRTCYRYDANGNQISETSPQANLSSCP